MLAGNDTGVEVVKHPLVLALACDAGIQSPFYALSDVCGIVAAGDKAIVPVLDNIYLTTIAGGDRNATASHALDQCVAKRLVARGGKYQPCV